MTGQLSLLTKLERPARRLREEDLLAALERLEQVIANTSRQRPARSIACGPSPVAEPEDESSQDFFYDVALSDAASNGAALSTMVASHQEVESLSSSLLRDEHQAAFHRFFLENTLQARRWWIPPFDPERGTLESTLPHVDWVGEDVYNIEKDVDRTFPASPFFLSIKGVPRIKVIAAAYAVRNNDVGYCQGMNFIIGYLLMALEVFFPNRRAEEIDEQTYRWLSRIVESPEYNQKYYSKADSMTHLKAEFVVLESLLEECLPEVCHHIHEFSTTTPIIMYVASKWFIAVFIDCLQPDTLVHVWDMYLQHGILAVFWVSLLIFHQCKDAILQSTDLEIINVISRGAKQLPVCCLRGRLLQTMQQTVTRERLLELRSEVEAAPAVNWHATSRSCDADLCTVM